jgi:hypothetical protein
MPRLRVVVLIGLYVLVATSCFAKTPAGDWPMTGGGLLRPGRAEIKGKIAKTPNVLWTSKIGFAPGYPIVADFDGDGKNESYRCENWRVVRYDADGQVRWRSEQITRSFTLTAFDDLDGDGTKEPLMMGQRLNTQAPVYFVFDPATGRIRWKAECSPSNGGDYRFGKIDKRLKGLQLMRALWVDPRGNELHMWAWDKGIEQGYEVWSWYHAYPNDRILFPQLCVGDLNNDGQNEILLMSHMSVRMFDVSLGREICRVAWEPGTRSYGGRFNLYHMKPGDYPSIVISSYYNKMVVLDTDGKSLTVRWNHVFEQGEDSVLKGKEEFLPEGACDLDGDGWSEVVVNYFDGSGDRKWRAVVLGAKDGEVKSELIGKVIVGAADIDGDGKTELFLRKRVEEHDTDTGPVTVAKWAPDGSITSLPDGAEGMPTKDVTSIWTGPTDGALVREPNDPALGLSFDPDPGDRVKLADTPSGKVFFIRDATGKVTPFAAWADTVIRLESATIPPDLVSTAHQTTAQGVAYGPTLAADVDGDGLNEIITAGAGEDYLVLKPSRKGEPKLVQTLKGLKTLPVFADIDGDGKLEMIAVRMGAASDDSTWQQHCVEATRANGDLIWRRAWPKDFGAKWTAYSSLAAVSIGVGHFTGQKSMDVVVNYLSEKTYGHVAVLDAASGKTIWDLNKLYPDMYGTCQDIKPPVVFDYDGDGLDDIAMTCNSVHYTILRGKDGKQLVTPARDVSDQAFGGQPSLFKGAWAVQCALGAADADGDGKLEMAVLWSQSAVGSFHPNGEEIWHLKQSIVDQIPNQGCWADVNADGRMELAYPFRDGFLRAYHPITGEMLWEEGLGALGTLMAADVNGDGADEILLSSEKGKLYCMGKDADPISGSHIKWVKQLDGAPGQAIFADVNGDGKGEILVPCSDGNLYCLGRN